jgi:PAS domain S-box-containing protein
MSESLVTNWRLDWLRRQLEEKESIINGISDGLMLLDAENYEILDVNQAFLNLYKVNRDQVIGNTCHEITHHLPQPCSQLSDHEPCPLEKSVSTGDSSQVEHVHKDREGNDLYIEIRSYPIKDARGEVTRIIHLSRDVTNRRVAEEALKEKVTQSEHLAALGQLVAEITHEIKNPLMMIGGFARQLFQPADEETKVKKLTIIIEQVHRLEKLLADLREFYRPKAPTIEVVNIKRVLERVYSLVRDECAKKNIRTELKLDEKAFLLSWDPSKLEQLFLNVIKNSIEAMGNGGNLSIQGKLSGDKVEISIDDDGCGIPKEHMDKIMDCFFTTKSYGTGLGLCISKKFIDEYDGSSLSVKSEEGKGTTVNVTLALHSGGPEPFIDL